MVNRRNSSSHGGRFLVTVTALAAALGVFSGCQNLDLPGVGTKIPSAGRTKNAISAVIAGTVGHRLYENSSIDMTVEKPLWADAELTGSTTRDMIDTTTDLWFTSAHYAAKSGPQGFMQGEVHKSEFNWKVKEAPAGKLDIGRFFLKWNGHLDIIANDGKISGTYERTGLHWDWDVTGTYDSTGHTHVDVDVPLGLDFSLEGYITPTQN